MTETPTLRLPLIAPGQAQKHVTVNEALARIDALCQLTLRSITGGEPQTPEEGAAYGVPAGATGGRILATLAHEMRRRGSRYGIETMCMGGGQGLATIVERIG